MELIVKILLILSLFFFTTATIGFLRFPDFYSRMHATGKGDTLGILLALLGLAIYHLEHNFSWPGIVIAIKLIFIAVFWFLGGPTATHALLRSAFDTGIMPWTKDGRPVIEWPPKRGR